MPSWSVTQPGLQLMVQDMPFFYNTSRGRQLALELHYKQDPGPNGRIDTAQPAIFSFGTNWNCSWRSYIQPLFETNAGTIYSNTFLVFLGDGSARQYIVSTEGATANEPTSSARFTHNTGSTDQYEITFPDGSKNIYSQWARIGDYDYCFMTHKVAQGATNLFSYALTNVGAYTNVRLATITDPDGKQTALDYTTNGYYSSLVTQVLGPYGLTNRFEYDTNGHLTNVTDVAGLASRIVYDSQHRVTQFVTPYGTNSFDYYTNSSGWKALRVNELGIRQSLYLVGFDGTNIFPGGTAEISSLDSFLDANGYGDRTYNLDSSGFDARNTFFWAPRQYQHLPSSIRTSLNNGTFNPADLTTNDFQLGWTRHWLKYSGTNILSEVISIERSPSASDDGSTEGLLTWYDYDGKTVSDAVDGNTARHPSVTARRLPGGDWHVTIKDYNYFGKPTGVTENYTAFEVSDEGWWDIDASPSMKWRTHSYEYATSGNGAGIDLVAHALHYLKSGDQSADIVLEGYAYNSFHQVTYATNATNEVTIYTYDGSNWLASITQPSGLITDYSYNTDGFLSAQIQRSESAYFNTNQYTYTNGYIFTHTDPRGRTVTNFWDALGRLTKSVYPDGSSVSNVYDKLDLVRVYDRMGFTNDYRYNGLRDLVYHTNANRKVTTYQYCDCGGLESVIDPLGNTTSYSYDNLGQRLRTTFPGSTWTENVYDFLGRAIRASNSAGNHVTNDYTVDGRLWKTRSAEGIVALNFHNGAGEVNVRVSGSGVRTVQVNDGLGRMTQRRFIDAPGGLSADPSEADEWFIYSARGLILTTNRDGKVTRFQLDELGRKLAETNANTEVVQFAYSPAGDLVSLVDAKLQTNIWKYDVYGHVTNKIEAAGHEVFRYTYDANGRLATRWTPGTGGSGLTTQYSYDAMGNLTKVDYPNSEDVTLQYDDASRLTNMLDAAGTTRYTYTGFGALQSEDGPWGGDTVSYGYDNARRRASLSLAQPNAGAWAQSYLHDSLGRLTNVVSPAGTFGYALYRPTINPDNGASQSGGSPVAGAAIHWQLLPGGANVTNTFDVDGRLLSTALLDAGRNVLNSHSYEYSDAGLRTRQTRTDGSYVDYGYDNAGQLTAASGKESGGAARAHEQFGYDYDGAGNLNWRTNNALVQEFSVNNLNELMTVGRSGTFTVAGGAQGNPSSVTVNGQAASLYGDATFAKDGFSLSDGTNTFTAVATDSYGRYDTNTVTANLPATVTLAYDLNGNLRTNGTRLLDYDDENQLIRVTEPGAWQSEFVYDGKMRRRVRREFAWRSGTWVQTQEVRYVYDGNLVIQERNGLNLPQVTYTRGRDLSGTLEGAGGIGGLLARTDNVLWALSNPAAHAYYHADGNGSVTCLANVSGLVAARYLYDPFGNTLAAAGPLAEANLYRFSSKELHPASGLVYYLYRYYDPGLQRWANRDPAEESGGLNLYAFVGNNPLLYVDGTGLDIFENPVCSVDSIQRQINELIRDIQLNNQSIRNVRVMLQNPNLTPVERRALERSYFNLVQQQAGFSQRLASLQQQLARAQRLLAALKAVGAFCVKFIDKCTVIVVPIIPEVILPGPVGAPTG